MFKLRRLEERIVLDGAGWSDIEDYAAQADDLQANEASNLLDADYGLDSLDDLLDIPGGLDSGAGEDVNVLVIDTNINGADDLAAAAKDGVIVIKYDASGTTFEGLAETIHQALGGKEADSIAFAVHNSGDGVIELADGDKITADSLSSETDQQDFFKSLGDELAADGRIDLLACNVADSAEGEKLVETIEEISGVNVAASTDLTGNEAYGGDWVLETDGVDVQSTYFDAEELEKYEGTLATPYVAIPIADQLEIRQHEPWQLSVAGTVDDADPPPDYISYFSASDDRPAWMNFDYTNNMYYGTPSDQSYVNVQETVSLIGYDTGFNMVIDQFDVKVVDNPYVVTPLQDQFATQYVYWEFIIPAGTFDDPDLGVEAGETLNLFSASTDRPAWMSFDYATSRFYGTPMSESDVQGTTVSLIAYDSSAQIVIEKFNVTVGNGEAPPFVTGAIAEQTVYQDSGFKFTMPSDVFDDNDLPNDKITYFAENMPGWMSFDGANFTGTPTAQSDVGSSTVIVKAYDNMNTYAETTFNVSVIDFNQSPVLDNPIPDQTVFQGQYFELVIPDNTFSDPDGDPLAYFSSDGDRPHWLSFNYAESAFQGTPTAETDVGTGVVSIIAYDPDILIKIDQFNIEVIDVNSPPSIANLDVAGETVTYTEGGSPVKIDINTPASITDTDSTDFYNGWLTVDMVDSPDATEDVLDIDTNGNFTLLGGTILKYKGNDFGVVEEALGDDEFKIRFTTSEATPDAVAELVQSVTYSNSEVLDVADGERTVRFQISDGDGAFETSDLYDVTVDVKAVNSAPALENLGGDTHTFTEGGAALKLDMSADALVSDPDSADFSGGTLTVEITSSPDFSEDKLYIDDAAVNIDFNGTSVEYSFNEIGTASFSTGKMVIALNEQATPDRVSELIQNITYENTDTDDPAGGTRNIQFTLTDGDGGTVVVSPTVDVNVVPVNDNPVVADLDGDTALFVEDGSPVVLDSGSLATVTDVDSANFDGGTLTAEITGGLDAAEDVLGIRNYTDIAVNAGNVYFEGKVFGTYDNSTAGFLEVNFNSSASQNAVSALLSRLTYENTNTGDPSMATRTVEIALTDGDGGASNVSTVTVNLDDVNDTPVINNLAGDTSSYMEGDGSSAGAAFLDDAGDAVIVTDADMTDFDGGRLTVEFVGGEDTTQDVLAVAGSHTGISGTTYTNGVLEVNFDATSDADSVSEVVQNIVYYNQNSIDVDQGTRSVRFTLYDGDGEFGTSASYDVTVDVTAENDAPEIVGIDSADSILYTEGDGTILLDSITDAYVVDVDSPTFNGGKLTVSITNGDLTEDELGVNHEGWGLGLINLKGNEVYYDVHNYHIGTIDTSVPGEMTIDLLPDANSESVSALIQNITYTNTDVEDPTEGMRSIRFQFWDGGDPLPPSQSSAEEAMQLYVQSVNDAPVVAGLDSDVAAYTEGAPAIILDQGGNASVADVDSADFNGGKLVVSIAGNNVTGEDVLGINSAGDLLVTDTYVSYAGNLIGGMTFDAAAGELTVDFTTADADTASVAAILQNITYENSNTYNPDTTDRKVQFTLWDGDGTANGGVESSDISEVTVTIDPVNSAPVIDNLAGDSISFTEADDATAAAQLLDNAADAIVTDLDSPDFKGGSLSVTILGGGSGDELYINNEGLGTDLINVLGDKYIYYDNGNPVGNYTFANGKMDITLDGGGANTESLSALIQNIGYTNTDSNNPLEGERTIRFVLSDGDGGTSSAYDVNVMVNAVNDAPILEMVDGDTLSYTEGDGPVLLDQDNNGLVTDVDHTTFNGGKLTVQLLDAVTTEDVIGILDGGKLTTSGTAVKYDGNVIGTFGFDQDNGLLQVNLGANSDSESVSALVQQISYENTNVDDPDEGPSTIRFTLWDGDKASSAVSDVTIDVTGINDTPEITGIAGDNLTYTESTEGAVALVTDFDSNGVVSDVDSTDFNGGYLQVEIVGGGVTDEDVLSIRDMVDIAVTGSDIAYQGSSIGTMVFDDATGKLTVDLNSEYATPDAVSALLQSVTYQNTDSQNPTDGVRSLRFTVYDGDGANGTSAASDMTVTVVGVNDDPVISGVEGDTAEYVEDAAATTIVGTDAMVTDLDSADFDTGVLRVVIDSTGQSDSGTDVLGIANQSGITTAGGVNVNYNGTQIGTYTYKQGLGKLEVALNADANTESVSALIQSITYQNTNTADLTSGARTVMFTMFDGDTGSSSIEEATVYVTGVNDSPDIANLDGDNAGTFTEATNFTSEGLLLDVSSDALVTDVDSIDFENGTLTVRVLGDDTTDDVLGIDTSSGPFDVSGGTIAYLGNQIGAYNDNWADSTLVITFDSDANAANVSALIRQIAFSNTDTYNPVAGERTVRFSFYDGDYTADPDLGTSAEYDVNLNVQPINDAPVLDNVHGASVSYSEGAAATILNATGGQVTDVDSTDFDGGYLSVKIQDGLVPTEDILGVTAGGGITVVSDMVLYNGSQIGNVDYDGATGELKVDFNANADTESVEALIQSITYENSNTDNPNEGDRTVSFSLYDGDYTDVLDESASMDYLMTVMVTGENDAPVINELDGDAVTWTEDASTDAAEATTGNVVKLDAGELAKVIDMDSPDFDTGHLTVEIFGNTEEDVLGFATQAGKITASATTVGYNGVQIGTYTFTDAAGVSTLDVTLDSDADAESVSALVQSITYSNSNTGNPEEGETSVRFVLSDGDGATSADYTTKVVVKGVNDDPVLWNLDNESITYSEGTDSTNGAKLIEDNSSDSYVTDADNAEFAGGKLTIQITAGGDTAQDVLGISQSGSLGLNGNKVTYLGAEFGTFTQIDDEGMLIVDFTSTEADTAAVSALIQSITYQNTDTDDPTPGARTVRYFFEDGDGGTAMFDQTTVLVVPVNDAPVISQLDGDMFEYVESDDTVTGMIIDQNPDASVSDVDNKTYSKLEVSFEGVEGTDYFSEEDVLSIRSAGDIGYFGTPNGAVSFQGDQIGTATFDGSTLTVGFEGFSPDAEAVSTLLQQITYVNTDSLDPEGADRTVSFVLYDAGDTDAGLEAETSNTAYVTINVTPVNDAPEISGIDYNASDFATFTEYNGTDGFSAGAVILDVNSNAGISDVDNTEFSGGSLVVQIEGGATAEDYLTFSAGSAAGIDWAGTATTGTVAYQGAEIGTYDFNQALGTLEVEFTSLDADTAAVTALMRSISYNNDSDTPTEGERLISFKVSDNDPLVDGDWSDKSYAKVEVVGVNDAPVINDVEGSITYTEGDGAALLDIAPTLATVTDGDSADFDGGELIVEILADGAVRTEDILGISTGGDIGYDGYNVTYKGDAIGNATFNSPSGTLKVNFDTVDADAEALSALVQSITYSNDSEDPTETARTIRYTLDDGDGASSDYSYVSVGIVGVNDAPVITNLDGDKVDYYENDYGTEGGVNLSDNGDAIVTDVDTTEFDTGKIVAQIVSGFSADTNEDMISFDTTSGIMYNSVSKAVLYNGTQIGMGAYNSNTHTMNINLFSLTTTEPGQEAVTALINSLTYANMNSDNPTEGDRTIEITFDDGDADPVKGTSEVSTVTVSVHAVNDSPVIDGGATVDSITFSEDDGTPASAMVIEQGSDAFVTDVDSTDFDGGKLTVSIIGGDNAEDMLSVRHQGTLSHQIAFDGTTVSMGTKDFGTASFDQGSGVLTVDLNANADSNTVASLIRNITYYNTDSDNPTEGERTVRFNLYDGDYADPAHDAGTSAAYDMTVLVQGVNDAPEFHELAGDTNIFYEGDDPVFLDGEYPLADVTDVDSSDFDGGHLKVQILNAESTEDVIGFDTVGDGPSQFNATAAGSAVYYEGVQFGTYTWAATNGLMDITLDSDANEESVSALVQSLTYANTDTDDPTGGDRTIRFTMSDGDAGTSVDNDVVVTVQPINDAPVISNLDSDDDHNDANSNAYIEGEGPVVIDGGDTAAVVSDVDSPDFDGGTLSVWIDGADTTEDLLGFSITGDISVSGDAINKAIAYNGTVIGQSTWTPGDAKLDIVLNAKADTSAVSSLIQSITYENTDTDDLNPDSRTVKFQLNDGDGTDYDGVETSNIASVTIDFNLSAANSAPEIHNLDGGDDQTYLEDSGAVAIDVGTDAYVTDSDSENFNGGKLVATIIDGDTAEDVLSVRDNGLIDFNEGASAVLYDGQQIGNYAFDGSEMTIEFSDNAANTDAVSALIQNITYENKDTDNPTEGTRTVQFALWDGDIPIPDGQSSLVSSVIIDVQDVNDAPVITELDGDYVEFTEGDNATASAVLLDSDSSALVSDVDSTDFDGGTLKVTIIGGDTSEDMLGVSDDGTLTFDSGTNTIGYSGSQIGTYSWNAVGQEMSISLTADANTEAVSALLQGLTYYNTDTVDPTEGSRTIRYTLSDGDGTGSGDWSTEVESIVNVIATNDPPEIINIDDDGASQAYTEGDGAVVVDFDSDAYVTDGDSANFDGGKLEVVITGDPAEDVLGILNQGAGTGEIAFADGTVAYEGTTIGTGSYQSATGLLKVDFNSEADQDAVSALVQSITYQNSDEDAPTEGMRTLAFTMYDGHDPDPGDSSSTVYTSILVQGQNDAPEISDLDGDVVTFTEANDPTAEAVLLDDSPYAIVDDADSTDFSGGNLTVQITNAVPSEDVLSILDDGPGAGKIDVVGSDINYSDVKIGSFTYDSASGLLDIDFTSTAANEESVGALIQNIQYYNTDTDDPTEGDRDVKFTLSDGDNGTSVGYYTTVQVVGVNDAPVINYLDGDSAVFIEEGAPVALDAVSGGNALVTDVDNTDFDGGNLKVEIIGGDTTEDELGILHDGSTGAGMLYVDGVNISYDNEIIGTASFDADTGVLDVALNDQATPDGVSRLVQGVAYNNIDSDDPTGGERTVRFTLSDGDAGTSDSVNTTVLVVPVNDAPVINNLDGDSHTFTEGDDPVKLDLNSDATVTDVDSTDFDGGSMTITIAGGDTDQDVVSIADEGGIFYDDTNSMLYYGGEYIGDATENAAGSITNISFTSEYANTEAVTALVNNLTYDNTDEDNPTGGLRDISILVNDGDGSDSEVSHVLVDVVPVNDAPVISNLDAGTAEFHKGDEETILDFGTDATVTDADSTEFQGGQLSVEILSTNFDPTEDVLLVSTESGDIALAGKTVSYGAEIIGTYTQDLANGKLTVDITQDVGTEAISALIQNIAYDNTDTLSPTEGERTVRFTFGDGDGATAPEDWSDPADVTLSVFGNRAPVVDMPIPDTSVAENTFNKFDFDPYFSDPDGDDLTYSVTIDGTDINDPALDWAILKEDGTFKVFPDHDNLGNTYNVEVTVSDGITTASDSFNLTVTGQNNAPVLDGFNATETMSEHASIADLIYDVSATDVDASDTLTFSISGADATDFSINPGTGEIRLANDANIDFETGPQVFNLTVTVEDSMGATDTGTLTIMVVDENDAPVIVSALGDDNPSEGDDVIYTVANPDTSVFIFEDPDNDTLTYSVSGNPSWLDWIQFGDNTILEGTVPTGTSGSVYTIEITADDLNGGVTTDTFQITIASLDGELLEALDHLEMEGESLELPVEEEMDVQEVMMAEAEAPTDDTSMADVLALLSDNAPVAPHVEALDAVNQLLEEGKTEKTDKGDAETLA